MNKTIKKVFVGIVAYATCVFGSMSSFNASAYTIADNWTIFKAAAPTVPNQMWSDICCIPAYSGGYIVCCNSLVCASGACIEVSTDFGYTFCFTSPGCSNVIYSSSGGTATFTFDIIGDSPMCANGSIGYNF